MYQRRRRRPVSEMNVVPYIDVMLVLLIIFMATASVIAQGVKVDLPKAQAQTLETDEETIMIVSIDEQGLYYLNVGDNPESPMQAADIAAIVKTRLGVDPSIPVVVNGDRTISYEKVIDMMVLLQSSGAPSVGLMTDPNS
ncbi:protein TolR [Glaciecola siphonariae]|uniref:Tol-Pal system protein TolR n=1 Tax=Glaciecola siphonariae TaxID=521012 RepID=A0ABV9LSU0_9ALTE